jgi:hypothetical protein
LVCLLGGILLHLLRSPFGPERHLVRRSDMSEIEVKADSEALTAWSGPLPVDKCGLSN